MSRAAMAMMWVTTRRTIEQVLLVFEFADR